MAEPICHSFRSLVRPHDYHHSGLRTNGQGRTEHVIERGRCLRTTLYAVCGDGGGVCRGPRTTTSFGPQRELPPARLAIHRQTSAQNSVYKGTRESSDEVGHISVFLHPASLAVDNSRAPHSGARHEEADARKGVATPLSTEFWARNHAALEHIDVVVGHGRSGVPLSSTRLHQ